jgi:hypothetical protein
MEAVGGAETICAGGIKRAKHHRWGYVYSQKTLPVSWKYRFAQALESR